jgi:glycosyltransferase involved in cell wall biosynthesis
MRVLILAPWPLRVPRHGGQLRGSAVAEAYREGGHDVHTISFYDPAHTKPDEIWTDDLAPTQGVIKLMSGPDIGVSEMAFWRAMALASDIFERVVAVLRRLQPCLLQFEEPVLWPIVHRLRAEGHLDNTVVAHSSYNFETLAWGLRGALGAPVSEATLHDLAEFEREIASTCDLVFTVSEEDAVEFRKLGAARVHVAENGVSTLWRSTSGPITAYLPSMTSYALFVSSAHPPNARGFIDLAEGASAHPLRDGELMICGRVGPMITATPRLQRTRHVLDRSRILGWVDGRLLDALYAGSRVVILPKTNGGGSNLKTAEALASGRPIIATRSAFIGFERFMELPDVVITDEPDVFWRRVNDYLAGSFQESKRTPEAMSGLLWRECLKPMVRASEDAVCRVQHDGQGKSYSARSDEKQFSRLS